MRPRLIAAVAALFLLVPAAPAAALDAEQLRNRLASAFRSAGPASGAYARDLERGAELYARRADTPRVPASVEKLFVTATSLLRYGPGAQLVTRVQTAATVDEDGTLDGDLFLVGGGDPTLSEADLRRLAGRVRDAGVRQVRGRVVADDSRFDRLRGGPRTGGEPDADLGGRLGALVLGRGFQSDPARYAGERFAARLRRIGVRVPRRARVGRAPEGATELATVGSPSIASLVRATNVPSDNFLADMLLKNLGASFGSGGTTLGGAGVVRETLADLDVRPTIADGSGLSRANRTTPRMVVQLFERMDELGYSRRWRSSLAVAGRSGTVHRRMRGTAAHGRCSTKTGTIRGVSNLVGICTTTGGATVGFAWLMNGGISVSRAHAIQDRMTATLARYSAPAAPAAPEEEPETDASGTGSSGAAAAPASSG